MARVTPKQAAEHGVLESPRWIVDDLIRRPRSTLAQLRRTARYIGPLAKSAPSLERMVDRSRVNLARVEPDDPAVTCCGWCGAQLPGQEPEEGFAEAFCPEGAGGLELCQAARDAKMPDLEPDPLLVSLSRRARDAEFELWALTAGLEAFCAGMDSVESQALALSQQRANRSRRTPPM